MTITINGNGYPIFEANQVLKYTDLNSLFDYLDDQNRLTRIHLIGSGIVCGLTVSLDGTIPAVRVSTGCGITSEGYLIHLGETALTHYQVDVPVPTRLFDPTLSSDAETSASYSLVELYGQGGDDRLALSQAPDGTARDLEALQAFLNDQVLLAVCEPEDEQRDSCLVDCDDRGKDRSFRTRFFLLPRSQAAPALSAEQLLRQGYQIDDLGLPWQAFSTEALFTLRQGFWQAFELRVPRFGLTQETPSGTADPIPVVRLSQIKTYEAFLQNYYEICDLTIDEIATVFPQLFRLFSPFFDTFQPSTLTDFNDLANRLKQQLQAIWSPESDDSVQVGTAEAQYAIQYFYDYLSQLVAAYQELADTAFDLMDDCAPDSRRFPKFLMLGLLSDQPEPVCAPPSPYRSHFSQPPIYNGNAQRRKQVRHLYERLRRLCQDDAFYLLPFYDTPLKLTPSKDRSAPLSQQAIPYYLNYPNLYRYWNYDACRKGISDRHPAYFYPLSGSSAVEATDDLLHRLDVYNFYRIEGHIGEAKTSALEEIKAYQQRYNLAFDVITLKLAPSADLGDLNLSGHFDDLEADFGRIKDRFLKLWDKNQDDWSQNVFLNTLRAEFFDQPGLLSLGEGQLSNWILNQAKKADNYQFEAQTDANNQPTGQYRLYVLNTAGVRIAQYAPEGWEAWVTGGLIDFSGLSAEEIALEQERIARDMAACLSLGKVTFGLEIQRLSRNTRPRFRLRLSSDDEIDLPASGDDTATPTAPLRLLSLGSFFVNFDNDDPIITQAEFQDFETLYSLLRDIPDDYADEMQLSFQMGNRQAADCLNYFEFKGLVEAYQHRLERLKELHLFHKFAELHPGMEPLGGVPKGGTFILVYVDGADIIDKLLQIERSFALQARTSIFNQFVGFPSSFLSLLDIQREILNRADIVVADFCLPYRCCSDTPAVSYMLAQPRPIVLLEKAAFCQDDETRYEFMLDPAGGTLKGEGSFLENGIYYFQPSRIEGEILYERVITFTYVVEGSYDTLTVAMYPEPEASLSIDNESTFCSSDEPIEIILVGNDPAVSLIQLTINGAIVNRFDPSQYAQTGEAETIILEARLRDRRTNCENTLTREITIYPAPNAGFRFDPPPSEENGGYCGPGDGPLFLIADDPSVASLFSVIDENGEITELDTVYGEPSLFLDQYLRYTENGEPIPTTLTFIHSAHNEAGCSAEARQEITVYPLPNAYFEVEGNEVCDNSDAVAIFLNSAQPSGTLEALDPAGNLIEGAIQLNPPRFIPSAVDLGEANSAEVLIRYTVTGPGNCTNAYALTRTVYRTPIADFAIALLSATNDGYEVQVSNIRPQGDVTNFDFVWEAPGGNFETENPRNQDFTITYSPRQQEIVITLTVQNQNGGIVCASNPVTRRVLSVVAFNIFTINGYPLERGWFLREDREFKISEFDPANQYVIEAVTLPRKVGSVRFAYQGPDGTIQELPPVNGTEPYLMPTDWKPTPGIHLIKAAAYGSLNGSPPEGEALTIQITISGDDRDNPVSRPITPSDERRNLPPDSSDREPNLPNGPIGNVLDRLVNRLGRSAPSSSGNSPERISESRSTRSLEALLDARLAYYRNQLRDLGRNLGSRGDINTDHLADQLLTVDRTISEAEAIQNYQARVESLLKIYRETPDSNRRTVAAGLLRLSTASLLDRLVVGDLTETGYRQLSRAFASFRKVGIEPSSMRATWNPEALIDIAEASTLERLLQLFQ